MSGNEGIIYSRPASPELATEFSEEVMDVSRPWALPLGQDRENPGASILHGRTVETNRYGVFSFFSFFLPFAIQEGGVGSLVFYL